MWFQKPPLGTPLDWGNPLNDETVMALAMNEGHGDKVQDLSMNGNHGTLENFAFPPTVDSGWNPGQTGVGLNFNSGNDYVDCGNNASLYITDALTISTIIKIDSFPDGAELIKYILSSARDGYITAIWNTQKIGVYLTDVGGWFFSDSVVSTGWNKVACTWDGAHVRIYINGVLDNTPAAAAGSITYDGNVLVGHGGVFVHPADRFFDGPIDQPRIMNRAWSAKEVRDYAINPWQVYLDE